MFNGKLVKRDEEHIYLFHISVIPFLILYHTILLLYILLFVTLCNVIVYMYLSYLP